MYTKLFTAVCLFLTIYLFTPLYIHAAELENYGVLDAKNHQVTGLPRAIGDGVTDDTTALQQLINYAFKNHLVLVISPGTYLVSNTLTANQQATRQVRRWFAHQIVGSTKGPRPIIKLKPNSPGFAGATASQAKPVIRMFATCTAEEAKLNTEATCAGNFDGTRSISFHNGLRNLEIQIMAGNPGAIGIDFPASQYSFLEDITIKMESGFAGIFGAPGLGSTVGGLYIEGGRYGIYNQSGLAYTNNTTFANVTFRNQSDCTLNGLYSEKPITFVGFSIEKSSGSVFCGSGNLSSSISFIDGQISMGSSSSTPAFINTPRKAIAFINVYFRNTSAIYQHGTAVTSIPGYQPNTWYLLKELYAYDATSPRPAFIDGQVTTSPNPRVGQFTPGSTPPANLLSNHHWGNAVRSPDHLLELSQNSATTKVCNAKSQSNVLGNGTNNDSPGLQGLINQPNCQTIFLPRGRYRLSNTLTLGPGTTLAGTGTKNTELTASSGSHNMNNPDTPGNNASGWTGPRIVVTTVNEATARTSMQDIRFWMPTSPSFQAFIWRAGKKSILKNVEIRPITSNAYGNVNLADILFTGNAGGRWWGANNISVPDTNAPGHRRVKVENTSQPLVFYNFNVEDGHSDWQSEVVNSENFIIYGGKFEDDNGIIVRNGNNIGIFSLGNSEMQSRFDSGVQNVLWATINAKPGRGSFTEVINGATTFSASLDTPLTVYKRGQLNRSVFNFTDESTSPTPTDQPLPQWRLYLSRWFTSQSDTDSDSILNILDWLSHF